MSWEDILKISTYERAVAEEFAPEELKEKTAYGKPLSHWKKLYKKSNRYGMSFNEYMMFVIAPKYEKDSDIDAINER